MPITDQQAATLRALLAGEIAEHKRLRSQLDAQADQRPYAVLVNNAFAEAGERRFGNHVTPAEVTEFVADVRSRSESIQRDLDPVAGERVLLTALADGTVSGMSAWDVRSSQIILLTAMVADARLSDDELDKFMRLVRAQADEQLARIG